jgi:hypothetical protein
MSTNLTKTLNEISFSIIKIQKDNKRIIRISRQLIIGLSAVIFTSICWVFFIVFSQKSQYVAGKYGSICYKTIPANVTKPVYFHSLSDCLGFVSK